MKTKNKNRERNKGKHSVASKYIWPVHVHAAAAA